MTQDLSNPFVPSMWEVMGAVEVARAYNLEGNPDTPRVR